MCDGWIVRQRRHAGTGLQSRGSTTTLDLNRAADDEEKLLTRVAVLQSVVKPNSRTNPFAELLVSNLPTYIESEWFSWRTALFGKFDVLHFQWPENLVRAPHPAKAALKRAALRHVLRRARRMHAKTIVTIHNLSPHESMSRAEGSTLDRVYDSAAAFVALNDTDSLTGYPVKPIYVIPHGDYRQKYARRAETARVDGRLVYFGAIRDYKNVPGLVAAFREASVTDSSLSLVVAGKPWNESTHRAIEESAATAPVSLMLSELEEEDLVNIICTAQVVVLPYGQLYNSGSIFLALTLGVPVLVPRTPSTESLRRELGDRWVMLFDGPLTAAHLSRAIALTESAPPVDSLDLSMRDWTHIGADYGRLYRSVAGN